MQAANKNPPWARSAGGNIDNMNNGGIGGGSGMMQYGGGTGMYPQGIMQNAGANMMGMPMGQMAGGGMYPGNVVAYPTPRAMNTGAFPAQTQPTAAEQRVFTGTVTKVHNDFGFVDHDVFYQTSVCAKGALPKVNDRVLVEATYNANMPFKWNATRVQVLGKTGSQPSGGGGGGGYNAVAPPSGGGGPARDQDRFRKGNISRRGKGPGGDRRDSPRHAPPPKRARSKSPVRTTPKRREPSPPRKRAAHPSPPASVKYAVRVPKIPLDISDLDVTSMTFRYKNLYIPSDFFHANVRWGEAFPPQYPFTLHNQCQFHIMSKDVPDPRPNDAVLEPPDADYSFSAKVMLISLPSIEAMYQKCGLTKVDPKEKRDAKAALHPTRLIKFLVGQKGKSGDSFAIGGPWSPSLDGPNPDKDPAVLVRTAIRTTKALTGVDLAPCTQWFRMVEFHYWREGAGDAPGRLETVVLFLPDVWSAVPTRGEWGAVQDLYKTALARRLNPPAEVAAAAAPAASDAAGADDITNADTSTTEGDATLASEETETEPRREPTHHSQLDMRTIKVDQLREELEARGLSNKGLRAQLLARLSKVVKAEEEEEKKKKESEEAEEEEKKKSEETRDESAVETVQEVTSDAKDAPPALDEKAVSALRSAYGVPSLPHAVVHPSPTARGGKFTCATATLSLLLDYRVTDNKEHSFEIFVFAELFNEMLQRDFGFYIYKTLYTLPEREEDKKRKEEEKKKDEDKKKEEEKKTDGEKKGDEDKSEEDVKKKTEEDRKEDKKDDKAADKKDDDRKKRESSERSVSLPPDPYLLLSLVYFDTSRCGHLARRDLQALCLSLGLQLCRSQLRHLLDKVTTKDMLVYRTLLNQIRDLSNNTEALQDLPLDGTAAAASPPALVPVVAELEASIASGNRDLLPVFDDGSDNTRRGASGDSTESGVVSYKGRLVDVGATLAALARSERGLTALERTLAEKRGALRSARSAAAQHAGLARSLHAQLADATAALAASRARVAALTVNVNLFHSTLKTIQSQVEGVVNIKYGADADDDVEIVNGPAHLDKEDKVDKKEAVTKIKDEELKVEAEEAKPAAAELKPEPSAGRTEPEDPGRAGTEDPGQARTEEAADELQPVNMDIDDK